MFRSLGKIKGVARVTIEHLSKTYPAPNGVTVQALSDLNLTVENEELLVLVGPSGCGKTTTLRLLAGLDEPSAGTISSDGRVMNGVLPKDRDAAMVFQNPALYPHLTVYENLAFGLKLRRHNRTEVVQRVNEAVEMLELKDCLDRLPMDLSGGQRQRVAIGRALVRKPALFLFDEPLSNLDMQMRSQLRVELARLHRRLKATSVHVTHDQVEAMLLGDRLAVLKEGKLQQVGTPLDLYHHPENLFVASFIGSPSINLLRCNLEETADELFLVCRGANGFDSANCLRLKAGDTTKTKLTSFKGKTVLVGLRPEQIRARVGRTDFTGQAADAKVERIETTGAEIYVHVKCANQPLVARGELGENVHADAPVQVVFDLEGAQFFDPDTEQSL
jgi:multiple sugar transport system ATP-binding protein